MSELQITFRHMPASDALRQLASEKYEKLKSHYSDALDCHVVVDFVSAQHRKGNDTTTHVELTIGRQHTRLYAEATHEDAYAGMRQAFESLKRQIEHRVERKVG
jgi:ribosomal subunit interface protein